MATKEDLKQKCRDHGIRGFSKLSKSALQHACGCIDDAPKNTRTKKDLQQRCRERDIRGISKLSKSELQKLCDDSKWCHHISGDRWFFRKFGDDSSLTMNRPPEGVAKVKEEIGVDQSWFDSRYSALQALLSGGSNVKDDLKANSKAAHKKEVLRSRGEALRGVYDSGYEFPAWSLRGRFDWASGQATTRLLYDSSAGSEETAMRLLTEREPTNIAMDRHYDESAMRKKFGWKRGAYAESTSKKLMPAIAVSCVAIVRRSGVAVRVPVINLIGLALDSRKQPDYKYLSGLSGKAIEKCVRRHYCTMWRFAFRDAKLRGCKTLVYYHVGAGAFSTLLKQLIPNADFDALLLEEMGNAKREEKCVRSVRCVKGANIPTSLFPAPEDKALYVNAWDPWSFVGNGNRKDNSLDGFWGRCSDMALRCWPLTNPNIAVTGI